MGRNPSRGRKPLRRPRRAGVGSQDHAQGLAAEEITARLQQIAGSDHPAPVRPAPNANELRDGVFQLDLTGSEVTDTRLLTRTSKPVSVEVFSVKTYAHPEDPGSVVLRLDGWEGHLVIRLPRDRAVVLNARLAQAIEQGEARSSRGGSPAPPLPLPRPQGPPRVRTDKWPTRTSHRRRLGVRDPRAIDSALDQIDDSQSDPLES